MSEKSSTALKTIGEVAEELDVASHVLRFWETKFKQIKPQKRRGRRYYRPEDVMVLTQIKALLYGQCYTIKGVQKFLATAVKLTAEEAPDIKPVLEKKLVPEKPKFSFEVDLFGNPLNPDAVVEEVQAAEVAPFAEPQKFLNKSDISRLKSMYSELIVLRDMFKNA
jgi:DNA-binding transcriptional MerR regulator